MDRKQLRRKFRKFWTPSEIKTKLYQRIWNEYRDLGEWLIEEAEKMEAWCATKNAKPSLLRFNNWLKNSKRFAEERANRAKESEDLDDYERRRTQERLKQYGDDA